MHFFFVLELEDRTCHNQLIRTCQFRLFTGSALVTICPRRR